MVTAARKIDLLNGVINESAGSDASSVATREWSEKALAVLRATLGPEHPTIASVNKTRFSPILVSGLTTDQDFQSTRRSGIGKVVAILKGAIAEVEATVEYEELEMPDDAPVDSTIFLVHGHADARKFEVAHFIEEETGRRPIILHEQADQSQTIIEKLERHGGSAGFAIVLLTADEEGRAANAQALSARARQNVVFEHGYFIGKLGRNRVVALHEDGVELPSDLTGVLYKKLSDNWKIELLRELRAAGVVQPPSHSGQASFPRSRGNDTVDGVAEVVGAGDSARGAFTSTWRHTVQGMEATAAMNGLQKRLGHPGYGSSGDGSEPPRVRVALLVAREQLKDTPSASDLRLRFLAFLSRPPVTSLVSQVTAVPTESRWSSYNGNGRLTLGAMLGDATQEDRAPVASALLNLRDDGSLHEWIPVNMQNSSWSSTPETIPELLLLQRRLHSGTDA